MGHDVTATTAELQQKNNTVPLAAEQVPLYAEFGAYRAANAHRCFWHEQRRARPDRCLRDVMFEVWTAQAAVCCGQVMGPLSWAQWSRMG